jgi:hypothetical protein
LGLTDDRHAEDAVHLDPNYCGECYGAPAPETATKAGCCNNCDEVRDAYAGVSWSFGRGEGVEQCQREHYAERLDAQRREGCRIEGGIRVNKVVGNFHFAPGKSFSNGNLHVHDLDNYFKDEGGHSFTHKIHQLRFGPEIPNTAIQSLGGAGGVWTNHHVNPLDGTEQHSDEKAFNFMYFVKVVSTAYLPLGWEKYKGKNSVDTGVHEYPHEWVMLGSLGHGEHGSIETHQYSVTSHKRSVHGGSDADEGHKERLHAKGGIPGVFFSYVSNPASAFPLLLLLLLLLRPRRIEEQKSLKASSTDMETGHFAHESHQPRNAHKDLLRLLGRRVRHHRRDADGGGGGGSRAVRGPSDGEEDASGLGRVVLRENGRRRERSTQTNRATVFCSKSGRVG